MVITKIVDKYYSLLNNTFVKYKSILIEEINFLNKEQIEKTIDHRLYF